MSEIPDNSCGERYAAFYRENIGKMPGLARPTGCPEFPAENEEPTVPAMAANFAKATARWAAAGFPVVGPEVYAARADACDACEFWDAAARFGLGKCKHAGCGCTKFKRWLSTEKCPADKWPPTHSF